jgi:hypothetical protein
VSNHIFSGRDTLEQVDQWLFSVLNDKLNLEARDEHRKRLEYFARRVEAQAMTRKEF